MTQSSPQPFILAPPLACGLSLTFALRPGADAREALLPLAQGFPSGCGMVGIGDPLARALERPVDGLRVFPALSVPGSAVPSTQQALWILLTGADQGVLFDRFQETNALIEKSFVLTDSMPTFIYKALHDAAGSFNGGHDLTGYEDGTENPKGDAAVAAGLVASGDGLAGSSFVAVQRWAHDLRVFRGHTPPQCDDMIGRRRDTNEEMPDAPVTSHVKRSTQESYDPPAFMVRRSMPWATTAGQGLEFIAYGHSLDAFERMLRRMCGLEDGIVDALFVFSRPTTGGYYWCPPLKNDGRLDLRILGL
jgi:porphyrinogen peroxidase